MTTKVEMEIMQERCNEEKNDYCIYENSFHINLMIITKQIQRAATGNTKKAKKNEVKNIK